MGTTSENSQELRLAIEGMHCASCEVAIERKLGAVPGVLRANVNHRRGRAFVQCRPGVSEADLRRAVAEAGYTLGRIGGTAVPSAQPPASRWQAARGGAAALVGMLAIYLLLRQLGLLPEGVRLPESVSLVAALAMGLVASVTTCMAVTGGLLLATAARYGESHPNLSGWQRFRPHLYFNSGRIISYAVLGGAVGALGSAFTISSALTGAITIVASVVMLGLGLQLLKLWPSFGARLQLRPPKWLTHRIHRLSETGHPAAPFMLGAATFFLPCGFTQALQLYVLTRGDAAGGALTMGLFALGTLPALLAVGAAASFTRGAAQRHLLRFAGAVAVLVGVLTLGSGLRLVGAPQAFASVAATRPSPVATDPNVQLVNGKQVVRMRVVGYRYEPSRFTVTAGIPVEWHVDGSAAAGCAQVLTAPAIGLTELLPARGERVITFTPTAPGTIAFRCSMGMTTPGARFTVVAASAAAATPPASPTSACDPAITACLPGANL